MPDQAEPSTAARSAASPAVGWHRSRLVLVVAVRVFFLFPLLAHGAVRVPEGCPTVLLGWSTLFDKWTSRAAQRGVPRPDGFWPTLWLSLQARPRRRARHAGAAAADGDVGAPAHPEGPRPRRVPHRAAVRRPADRPRRRRDRRLPGTRAVVPQQRLRCSSRSTPCWRMPFTYRALDAGIRAIDLRTLVDASRSLGAGWGTTMFRVLDPEHASRHRRVVVPHRHRRARRVHDRRRCC